MLSSSVVYRGIITSKFRTEKMYNFYQMVGDSPDQNTIFVTFGRSEPWAANESDPGFAPPYPNDTTEGVVDMWTNMMGSVKVDKSLLDAGVIFVIQTHVISKLVIS